MMAFKNMKRKILEGLPNSRIKNTLLWLFCRSRKALVSELAKVPVVQSGCAEVDGEQTPYVVLNDGTVLHGRWPTAFERELYRYWRYAVAPAVTEDTFRVAIDVIYRYLYPHAMPQLTMPYSRRARRCFHSQHVETIEDIPGLSLESKNELKRIYSLKHGESILDIGAYMGYGTVRLGKELGPSSKIYAVEADPESLWLLAHNVRCNNLSNVVIVPHAVSNREGESQFYKTSRQGNSLITDVVNSSHTVSVQTTTVDAILRNLNGHCVDLISITINGAEVEAVEGMQDTLKHCDHLRLSIAGWYKRNGRPIAEIISPILREHGFDVVHGQKGGVLAWK
jgi:FkbM family methyltransferase